MGPNFNCSLGTIAAGASATVTVAFTVPASTGAGPQTNSVTVTSPTDTTPGNNTASDTDTVETVADISITKDDGQTTVIAGSGGGTYTIKVSNAGPSDAQSVALTDTWPTGFAQGTITPSQGTCSVGPNFTCSLGTIAAGASATVTVSFTVPASTGAGPQTNSVTVTSPTDSTPGNNTASDTDTVETVADVSITKDDGQTTVIAGSGGGTYTIKVSNAGPSDAQSVALTDTWPTGFAQGTITPSQGTCSVGPNFTCSLGTIAAGASATVTVSFTVPASTGAGPQTNSVTVTSPTDSTAGNNTASDTDTVQTAADLSVTKTDGVTEVTAGDGVTYTYTIKVSNAGPSDAQSVALADIWPTGFTQGAITPSQGTCSGAPNFTCSLGTIAAGASATVTVNYTVPSSTAGGSQTNSATATSDTTDPNATNNTGSDTNTVKAPDLKVEKNASPAGPVSAGDEIGFDVKLSNVGNGTAFGVSFTDTLPNSGLSWSIAPASSGWSISGNSLVYSPTTLAAGASTTVHVKATTSPANCGPVSNTASASASNENSSAAGNNSATASVTVNCPDVSVSKIADASPVNAGNPIGFKITVSNIGPGLAKSVTLSDTLPTNPGLVWAIDPNPVNTDAGCSISSGVLSCSFGNLANGASKKVHITATTTTATCGSVTNTATAAATNEKTSGPDQLNNSATATIVLTDVTAPVINLTGQPMTLWSPNHKYVTFQIADFVASVSDSCNTTISLGSVYISKVTSDEPENINSGDGNTLKDMVIANDCKSVDLRAERDGSKNGRVYTITFKVTDTAGNVGTNTAKVTVPHSQGPKGTAIEDAVAYTVTNPNCP